MNVDAVNQKLIIRTETENINKEMEKYVEVRCTLSVLRLVSTNVTGK